MLTKSSFPYKIIHVQRFLIEMQKVLRNTIKLDNILFIFFLVIYSLYNQKKSIIYIIAYIFFIVIKNDLLNSIIIEINIILKFRSSLF